MILRKMQYQELRQDYEDNKNGNDSLIKNKTVAKRYERMKVISQIQSTAEMVFTVTAMIKKMKYFF